MIRVLYEDNHLIAVYKEAGILTQAAQPGDQNLLDEVRQYLKTTYHKPGNVFVGLLHRLDRNVEGIVLFAKTSKGAARLSEQIRTHAIKKTYHVVCHGIPPAQTGTLVHFLRKDEAANTVSASTTDGPGSQRAELSYTVVRQGEKNVLLRIDLQTGRSHQIRAQLSAIGCPVVGDIKYGSTKKLPNQKLALAATALTFQTATTHTEKTITIPPPAYFASLLS